MKIRLIEPISPSRHLWSKSYFVRLGLPMIGAALVEAGHDVRIFNPQLSPIDWADVYSSDLVGLSSTTSTIVEAYRIGDDLRRRGIPVIVGGSHVTFMEDEALQHADYVARGEAGETIMVELAEALAGDRELSTIAGISYWGADGQAVHAPLHERCEDLDTLPFPDITLIDGYERISNTPIMTSWGCPFDCTFCSVTAMFGKKYRFRSAESVVAEIKEKKPEKIFFYDDNFAANKKRLKRLLQLMIDEGIARAVGRAGAHRRRARPRAAGAHAGLEVPTSSPSASSRSTRPRWTASRSPRPSATSSTPSGCSTTTASAATACSCSAPTTTRRTPCATP